MNFSDERLDELIEKMKNRHIVVIGDLMVDEYIMGNVERISPEAPVPVLDVREDSYTLGGAGNVAKNIVSLGSKVSICSVIGLDNTGEKLVKLLKDYKINTDGLIVDPNRQTTVKTRIIANTQQIIRVDRETRETITQDHEYKILDYVFGLENIDAIIVSDYAKGIITPTVIGGLVNIAETKGIFINVDPKEKNYHLYKYADTITPNLKELSIGSNIHIEDTRSIEEAALKTFELLHCKNILATRGKDGMSIFSALNDTTLDYPDITSYYIPTVAKKVFDVTGAGDTVISCFTLAQCAGASILEAAFLANVAAGIVVGELGAATVKLSQLKRMASKLTNEI